MKLVKRSGASNLVMTVLIWSVVSVLGTRIYFRLAGNPQIAWGQWHIAHMLFGGLIMMLMMLILFTFEGKNLMKQTAVGFGLGWGLFIDEVGKFITRSNDYWTRPAIMIIYISFVILFLVYKFLERKSRSENVPNRIVKVIDKTAAAISRRKVIMIGLWSYSIYYSLEKFWEILNISASPQKMKIVEKFYQDYDFFGKSDIYMIVFKMVFDALAAILFLLGAGYFWSKKRNRGIKYFRYGLYVNILLASVFKFYFEQLGAVFDVFVGILLLEILNQYGRNWQNGRRL